MSVATLTRGPKKGPAHGHGRAKTVVCALAACGALVLLLGFAGAAVLVIALASSGNSQTPLSSGDSEGVVPVASQNKEEQVSQVPMTKKPEGKKTANSSGVSIKYTTLDAGSVYYINVIISGKIREDEKLALVLNYPQGKERVRYVERKDTFISPLETGVGFDHEKLRDFRAGRPFSLALVDFKTGKTVCTKQIVSK